MTFEVNGFDGRPSAPSESVPQSPVAAPAAQVPTQPQATPGAMQPQTENTAPQAPAVPSQPVTLFGRTFESSAQAEDYARHMVRSAENRNKAELERLRSVAMQTNAPQPVQTQPQPQEPPPDDGAYDIQTYMLVKNQYGEEAAEHYRSKAIAASQRTFTEKMLADRLAPFEQNEEQRRVEEHAKGLFSKATEAVGSNGLPLLPELRNAAEAEAVVKIWQDLPPEFALTPQGVWNAVMSYRGLRSMQTGRPSLPPPSAPPPTGQSVDSGAGPMVGFQAGQPQQNNIPRQSTVNPITGERYARS